MKIAAYLRVSTSRQADAGLSLSDQLRAIELKTKSIGGTLVETFVDRGKSGTNDRRPEFQRMLALALSADHPFDAVMVYSTSRFARDLLVSESSIRDLEKCDVLYLSATQEVSERLTRGVLALVDENHPIQNSKKVGKMMFANAAEGFWNGGPPPFGYRTAVQEKRGKKEKKILVVDEFEASIIRLVFDLCLRGDGKSGPMGVKSITDTLNARGFKTRRGNDWQLATVHQQLTSTYAAGFYLRTRGTKSMTRSSEDGKTHRIECPRIVDDATYAAVQTKLKRNNPLNTAPRVASADHLLTGIAVCACCGGLLTITTGKSGKYKYYSCRTHLAKGKSKCARPTRIPASDLDTAVISAIAEEVVNAERLAKLLHALTERRSEANAGAEHDVLKLEQCAAEEKRALTNIFDLVEKGLASADDPDFAERFQSIKTRKAIADKAVIRARARLQPTVSITPEMVVRFSEILRTGLSSDNTKFKRAYLSALVDKVDIEDDRIVIHGRASSVLEAAAANCNDEEVPRRIQEWRT